MAKINELDFTGIAIFCGIDVHKVSWRVNIRDTELELKDFTQPADSGLLHKHLSKNYPGANYKVGYEAGFFELNAACLGNRQAVFKLLMDSSWYTLQKFSADKKWMGAVPGVISVLHSWGQQLSFHLND